MENCKAGKIGLKLDTGFSMTYRVGNKWICGLAWY